MTATASGVRTAASLRWRGHWIAPEPRPELHIPADFLRGRTGGTSSRSLFRRTFELSEVPAEAPARLTADSRYVLWVKAMKWDVDRRARSPIGSATTATT